MGTVYHNRVKFLSATSGTASFGIGEALLGYRTPAQANIVDGRRFIYVAHNAGEWEIGNGTFNSAAGEVARTKVIESSNTDALVNFSAPPIVAVSLVAQSINHVHVMDFGAKCDGTTDDTAALNACFESLRGSAGTVVWGPGYCRTTGPIIVGQISGLGVTSFISIECPLGSAASGIKYAGPTDGTALVFGKNKYFTVQGLHVVNLGARGTTVGIILGGDTAGGGTETLSGMFNNCMVQNFHLGIQAGGNNGATSEMLFNSLTLGDNNTGFKSIDYNSLDLGFNMLSIGGNGIGIDSGSSSFWVNGGSASENGIDFNIGSDSSNTDIQDFRSETADCVIFGAGGHVSASRLSVSNAQAPDYNSIAGTFANLMVRDSVIEGYIRFDGETTAASSIILEGNSLGRVDAVRRLPFIVETNTPALASNIRARLNVDTSAYPPPPLLDIDGTIGMRYDGAISHPFVEPSITLVPLDRTATPQLGVGYLALSHVRQLSEGSLPGAVAGTAAPTPGQNLRVSGAFATSGSLAFTFKRTLTTNSDGTPTIVATSGTFLPTDVGKPIKITGGADTSADWYGYITDYISSTSVKVYPALFISPGGRYPYQTGKTTTVGADEPDAEYFVAGICGDANETFWVTDRTATGFTMHSSNASSTATVVALIVR